MIVNGNSLSLQPSSDVIYAVIQVKKLKDCKWEIVHGYNAGIQAEVDFRETIFIPADEFNLQRQFVEGAEEAVTIPKAA